MTAQIVRRMTLARASIVVFVVVALLTAAFMFKLSQGDAAPPANVPGVPHYFGPWPNWALSPLTLPDAAVAISGDGSGATATATVGGNGVITDITVTDPGSGYTHADVAITGAGDGATASATVTPSGVLNNVNVTAGGGAYTKPVVGFSGGGATTQATATAYGSLDSVKVTNTGSGYTKASVEIDFPDDPNGTQATAHATLDQNGAVAAIAIDDPGTGYSAAPNIVIRDGTVYDPIRNGGTGATAKATVKIDYVGLDTFGVGYTSAPTVNITDATGAGAGATAVATAQIGGVTAVNLTAAGSGYVTPGGIKKFQDDLPGLCNPAVAGSCPDYTTNPGAKYIPVAVPENKLYKGVAADQYEIAVVQYRTNFSSSLPDTLARGYVQLETPANYAISQHYPLTNASRDRSQPDTPIMDAQGNQMYGITPPQWLGPIIQATKNKPVRIIYHNLLQTGQAGELPIPVDTSMMGSGMGPMAMPAPVDNGTVLDEVRNPVCGETPTPMGCFSQNRAELHLHGGITPWISDGTPDQWITPAGEDTMFPQGVAVQDVPDMTPKNDPTDGIQTYYYTNQQSARLLWYHDHAWGITRLNVYMGEVGGYIIGDDTEKKLVDTGTIPAPADTIPLIIQDRTFVPHDEQLYDTKDQAGNITAYGQDPTWDKSRWGSYGDFWYHHVYMPAQNPNDPSGLSTVGRWFYGPWFWPPFTDVMYGPIDNPYFDPTCKLDDPSTWTYDTDPFCEPPQIPGTPNISAGMEQFNDTAMVNGVAYPKVTLQPKSYRFRVLNGANDRFWNLQWYIADPRTGTNSEVALDPATLAAAQTDPNVLPVPDTSISLPGPDWIQIGTEGGFLPAPTIVDGQQPMTWITDPSRFDWGNGDKHSLLVAPAERADVIVDFSQFAGQTLILYNDAAAAFPGRVASYDYYTGAPDMSPGGAPVILPGYGPNTRTIMQVTVAAASPAPTFDFGKLRKAFLHKADGSGVFESGQHPIVVGQAAYNSTYGTHFIASGNCNPVPNDLNPAFQVCDGFVRVADSASFGFNTLLKQDTKTVMPLVSKALHDETNSSTFDEYGRMEANLGVEAQPPTPMAQNVVLFPYVNPVTELIDGTDLPKEAVTVDANGNPVSDVTITPMSDSKDGTQIWRITHNGVDTHPIHFHLYDVQVINRVTWDNIIIQVDPNELGWKDTVRLSPLEDTIVALRPVIPDIPFEIPNSIRDLNPMMPEGSTAMFNNVDLNGNPTNPITNQLVNFGWEYVWHCHILSHEEMDMMRPQSLVLPPLQADGLAFSVVNRHLQLTFNDNSINETSFVVQRNSNGTTWVDAGTIPAPLDQPNVHEVRTFTDPATYNPNTVYEYRVVAKNTAGYGAEFPSMTAQSVSATMPTGVPPAAPSALQAAVQAGPQVALSFTDNATDESGFTVQRSDDAGVTWGVVASLPANTVANPAVTGTVTWTDTTVAAGVTYQYRVAADKGAASSTWSNTATAAVPAMPAAPGGLTVTLQTGPQGYLHWMNNATNADALIVQRALHGTSSFIDVATPAASATSWTDVTVAAGFSYDYRVAANNTIVGRSAWSNTATLDVPGLAAVPQNVQASVARTAAGPDTVTLTWVDSAATATSFTVQRATNAAFTSNLTSYTVPGVTTLTNPVNHGQTYYYRVQAVNILGTSGWSASASVGTVPAVPTNFRMTARTRTSITLAWGDISGNETGYQIQRHRAGLTTWSNVTTTGANATSRTDGGRVRNTTYYYRIRGRNAVGDSPWTAALKVSTAP